MVRAEASPRQEPVHAAPNAEAGTLCWSLAGVSAARAAFTELKVLEKSWACAYATASQENPAAGRPVRAAEAKRSRLRLPVNGVPLPRRSSNARAATEIPSRPAAGARRQRASAQRLPHGTRAVVQDRHIGAKGNHAVGVEHLQEVPTDADGPMHVVHELTLRSRVDQIDAA